MKPLKWWAGEGSNLRPMPCKGTALPTELPAHKKELNIKVHTFNSGEIHTNRS